MSSVRAPRFAGRRRDISLMPVLHALHVLRVLLSFPDHHLSKSDCCTASCLRAARRRKTKMPHLALGAGGAITSLPDPERFLVLYGVRLPASGPAPILPDANRSPSSTPLAAPISIATAGIPRYSRASRSLLFAPRSNPGAKRPLDPHTTLPRARNGTSGRAALWRLPAGSAAARWGIVNVIIVKWLLRTRFDCY